jgi:hypothetical protein
MGRKVTRSPPVQIKEIDTVLGQKDSVNNTTMTVTEKIKIPHFAYPELNGNARELTQDGIKFSC